MLFSANLSLFLIQHQWRSSSTVCSDLTTDTLILSVYEHIVQHFFNHFPFSNRLKFYTPCGFLSMKWDFFVKPVLYWHWVSQCCLFPEVRRKKKKKKPKPNPQWRFWSSEDFSKKIKKCHPSPQFILRCIRLFFLLHSERLLAILKHWGACCASSKCFKKFEGSMILIPWSLLAIPLYVEF